MDNEFFNSFKIEDRSLVSFIKREIHNLAINAGFSAHRTGEIDIIIAELTTNLIKYAGTGEILYRVAADLKGTFLELVCLDNGPGISNLSKMMIDGNTSSSSLGQGLGAINRLTDQFQVYTLRQWGCVQYMKIYQSPVQENAGHANFGAVQVCCPGEQICGDGYFVKRVPNGIQVFMGDGLGHGVNAHEAVNEAIEVFKNCKEESPSDMIRRIHSEVKKTRGLVATIAFADVKSKNWTISGVGNISTRIYNGLENKNYSPYNGIIGHNVPRTIHDSIVPLDPYQTLIMHSDGLKTRWNMADYPSLFKYDPSVIASVLFKDNARRNDDMTVLVQKIHNLL